VCRLGALGLAALALTFSSSAAADDTSGKPESNAWNPAWRRTSSLDLTLTGFGFASAFALQLLGAEETPVWRGPIAFDSSVRDAFVARSSRGRNRAYLVSDIALWTSVGQVVFDATVVSMLAQRETYTGYEMLMMDAEAYAVTVMLNSITKRLTARARPDTQECEKSANYDSHCSGKDRYMSFYSGHAAVSATSAGLICAHHQNLALYGKPWDGVACGASIMLTSLTGALRVVADRHWASDVLVGHLVGFSTGYFLPQLLHYQVRRSDDNATGVRGMFPLAGPNGTSVTVFGVF
jgi:hypothetical protein